MHSLSTGTHHILLETSNNAFSIFSKGDVFIFYTDCVRAAVSSVSESRAIIHLLFSNSFHICIYIFIFSQSELTAFVSLFVRNTIAYEVSTFRWNSKELWGKTDSKMWWQLHRHFGERSTQGVCGNGAISWVFSRNIEIILFNCSELNKNMGRWPQKMHWEEFQKTAVTLQEKRSHMSISEETHFMWPIACSSS